MGGGGRWVPGPEIIHCHEEIAYHFARDSLVFVPSELSLTWLPSTLIFSPGGTSLPPALNGPEHNGVGARIADGGLGAGQPVPRAGGAGERGWAGTRPRGRAVRRARDRARGWAGKARAGRQSARARAGGQSAGVSRGAGKRAGPRTRESLDVLPSG